MKFPMIVTVAASLALVVACGGGEKSADTELSMGQGDTLVPIADEATIPDTTQPAPPETVFVAKQTPPPAPRPTTRPTPRPPATAPAPTPAPTPTVNSFSLATGTAVQTTVLDSIHSHHNKVGDQIRLRVSSDVQDAKGDVVIPAGSVVTMSITAIAPAPNRGDSATLVLSGRSVTIAGESYPLTARSSKFDSELRARAIGTGEVAKTGAGAVAGGVIGRVIGGNKKGTIVGAVAGGIAGAAVASSTADRDIIVASGSKMTITLRDEFSRPEG